MDSEAYDGIRLKNALSIPTEEPEAFSPSATGLREAHNRDAIYGPACLRGACSEFGRLQMQVERQVAERTREIASLNIELQARITQAESADCAKGAFLANVSHEIRTPLNAVVGLTQLLADTRLDPRQRDYAEKIQLSAKALQTLVDNILDYSKIEAGALQLEQAPFSLDAILRTTALIVSVGKRSKPIEALFDVAPNVPSLLVGDGLRLQQLLFNLASNAVKFTQSGEIVVSVREIARQADSTTLQFSVRDTGIGIPPQHLGRIFDAFAQADPSTSRMYGGTGLGLAISAGLASLMGSRIDVESTVGSGSEFRFALTLGLVLDVPSASSAEGFPALRILIVDDHPQARQLMLQNCAAFGWQATVCGCGAEGLDELRQSTAAGRCYDLMVVDWLMPQMNGIDMIRAAHAAPDIGLPLTLLMTSAFDLDHAAAAGADLQLKGILAKPVTPATLFEAVTQAHCCERVGFSALPARN